MRVFLKKMLVFSLKASSRSGCFEMSAVIGPRLTAGHREIGRILVEAERLVPAAFSSLRDEAGDPWHLWIVEIADADFVVRRKQVESRADARQIVGRSHAYCCKRQTGSGNNKPHRSLHSMNQWRQ